MEFEGLSQVGKGEFLGFALAGYIYFQTLRDKPVPFFPNARLENSLHIQTNITHSHG